MKTLDRLIPRPRLVQIDYADVAAEPSRVWEFVRHGDLGRSPFVRALFALRTLPERLSGGGETRLQLSDLGSSPERPGFQVLIDEPPREVVVGAIGKVWKARAPFVHVAGEQAFLAFTETGFIKVAWSIAVSPRGTNESRVLLELRADSTDETSWKRFQRYYRVIGPGSKLIGRTIISGLERELGTPAGTGAGPRDDWRDVLQGIGGAAIMASAFLTPFLRRARSHWGLDRERAAQFYPGDELVANPRWSYTHAVEIQAAAEKVWPFVAQIGATRGGFYSYQWLENLAGCRIQNATAPHPEWLAHVGDSLVLHPDIPPFRIVDVQENRLMVAHARADDRAKLAGRPWTAASWLFLVERLGASRCRFVSRFRATSSDDLATRLTFGPAIGEPIAFAMDRRMVLGVKELAEAS